MGTDLLHDAQGVDKRRSRGYGIGMIEQVAKLQSDVEYIKRDIGEIRTDVREIRGEMRDMRDRQERDFRVLFGALVGAVIGLAGMMAKGFGWL